MDPYPNAGFLMGTAEAKKFTESMRRLGRLTGQERADVLATFVSEEHRTDQQSFVRFVVEFVKFYADAKFDGRNMAAAELCGELRQWLEARQQGSHLPYI